MNHHAALEKLLVQLGKLHKQETTVQNGKYREDAIKGTMEPPRRGVISSTREGQQCISWSLCSGLT